MKTNLSKILTIVVAIYLCSCASHKKFDFKNAYKFNRINYNKAVNANPTENEMEVSVPININQNNNSISKELIPIGLPQIDAPVQLSFLNVEQREVQSNNKGSFKVMTRADKKAFKKEMRKTIRDLRNEDLSKAELMASMEGVTNVQDDASSKKNRKIARYLLIGGGVLLIISLIIGSSAVLGGIGAAAIIAGAVLMLLSLDK